MFAAIIVIGLITAPDAPRPNPAPPTAAEAGLKRVIVALPKALEDADLPPVRGVDRPDDPKDLPMFTRLRAARMVSPTTAKVTISIRGHGLTAAQKAGVVGYGTVLLYLSWYAGAWTVERHEWAYLA